MIGIQADVPGTASQATLGEQIAANTRYSWEASSFDGLFESHLAKGQAAGASQADDRISSGGRQDDASNVSVSDGQEVPMAVDDAPVAARAVKTSPDVPFDPAIITGDELPVGEGAANFTVISMPPDSGEIIRPRSIAGADGTEPVSLHNLDAMMESINARITMVSASDNAEIYIRDATLDAESGISFVQAADRLMREHRLTLGRVKINGKVISNESDSPEVSSQSMRYQR